MSDLSQLDHLAGALAVVREPARRPERRHIKPPGIVVHHSTGRTTATVDKIRREHQVENGWADVGYHWLVREWAPGQWRAEPGRPEEYVGAHAPGRNDWIGICVLGNWELNEPPRAALEALIGCCSDVATRYEINAERIRPHAESGCQRPDGSRGETDCPGRHLIALLPQVREEVAALMAAA